jgi:hypothetical protein
MKKLTEKEAETLKKISNIYGVRVTSRECGITPNTLYNALLFKDIQKNTHKVLMDFCNKKIKDFSQL